ncbi:hypothetical protein VC83_07953 [Pseudogymnoascus destructans]|uniref:Uncharacterized protein n=2 Tax=Pseudogymnoascus destructans TaxID=655981 RepID=L8GAS6_PSED2|nr:uncharacterized protein VC83_07953 [Pseudogymnoascus destructans]ELR10320.1 hypothetical protein GMDG_04702 [Pseudogymnoascus destructans 20631-21]OAF56006.1 hypothetical protein VC83_07953 [Pseudogymnoascus destructans]
MAPAISPALLDFVLEKRQYYNDGYYVYDSNWNRWGRWVALVAIVGFFLVLAFACSCVNSRRRRRQGLAPRYGTGWLAGKPNGGQQHYQNNDYQGQQSGYNYGGGAAPAPPYSPPQQQYGQQQYGQQQYGQQQYGQQQYGGNAGYYGGQQSGIELQQPQNSYNPQMGREQTYEPPSGPPPGKQGDGIIR